MGARQSSRFPSPGSGLAMTAPGRPTQMNLLEDKRHKVLNTAGPLPKASRFQAIAYSACDYYSPHLPQPTPTARCAYAPTNALPSTNLSLERLLGGNSAWISPLATSCAGVTQRALLGTTVWPHIVVQLPPPQSHSFVSCGKVPQRCIQVYRYLSHEHTPFPHSILSLKTTGLLLAMLEYCLQTKPVHPKSSELSV